jgi:hypothetical protein
VKWRELHIDQSTWEDKDEVPGPREAVKYYLDLRAYGSAKMSKKKGRKRKDDPDGDFLVFSA